MIRVIEKKTGRVYGRFGMWRVKTINFHAFWTEAIVAGINDSDGLKSLKMPAMSDHEDDADAYPIFNYSGDMPCLPILRWMDGEILPEKEGLYLVFYDNYYTVLRLRNYMWLTPGDINEMVLGDIKFWSMWG